MISKQERDEETSLIDTLTFCIEAIDLYLDLLKKYEPMNKSDVVDAEGLKFFVQLQRAWLIKNE
jgi:hypothetical protein